MKEVACRRIRSHRDSSQKRSVLRKSSNTIYCPRIEYTVYIVAKRCGYARGTNKGCTRSCRSFPYASLGVCPSIYIGNKATRWHLNGTVPLQRVRALRERGLSGGSVTVNDQKRTTIVAKFLECGDNRRFYFTRHAEQIAHTAGTHTSLFLTPDGRHAGEITACSFSWVIVDAKVTACSPNLSLTASTAFARAAFFSRSSSEREASAPIFPEARERNAEEPDALAEAYPVEDGNGGAVDFAGIVRVGRQGGLLRKGFEIRIPDREGDLLAFVAVAPCPPSDPFAQPEKAARELLPFPYVLREGDAVAYRFRFRSDYLQRPFQPSVAHGLEVLSDNAEPFCQREKGTLFPARRRW